MKNRSLYGSFVVVFLVIVGCTPVAPAGDTATAGAAASAGAADAAPAASAPNTLTAVKVDAVALDSAADFWAIAPVMTVSTESPLEDGPAGPNVSVQAVYDENAIAMRFEWADDTESVLKNAWTWDGSAFSKSGDEDRMLLAFAIENNPEFASQGCSAACHNLSENQDEWWMGTDSEDLRIDAWHWKAARTHPAGLADDKWWGIQTDPTDPESSRHGDAKDSGGEKTNVLEDGSGPAFMHGSDLTAKFIMAGEEVDIDTGVLPVSAVVPGYVVTPMVGSRGDIAADATWADGKWVLVLMRPLDTGHDDDVLFTPPKAYPFGLSVMDNGGGLDHANAPDVLTLEWQ